MSEVLLYFLDYIYYIHYYIPSADVRNDSLMVPVGTKGGSIFQGTKIAFS